MSEKSSPMKPNIAPSSPQRGNPTPGSADCPFKLAIIGGGPAGCSVIVRALRIGVIAELCNFTFRRQQADGTSAPPSPTKESTVVNAASGSEKTTSSPTTTDAAAGDAAESTPLAVDTAPTPPVSCPPSPTRGVALPSSPMRLVAKSAGVCLIDAGPLNRLGGGRLQDYVINSNTWIGKFVTNVTEEKPDSLPPERIKGTVLERLESYNSSKTLEKMGNKTGPLHQVGSFLRDVGQISYQVLNQYADSSKCLVETKVTQLQQVVDAHGKFVMWKITTVTAKGSDNPVINPPVEIYATHVLLSTGGHQEVPKFTNPAYNAKMMASDVVCTEEGVTEMRKRLSKAALSPNNPCRVAIIGGSHSAFSAAWVCLHRVEDEEEKKVNTDAQNAVKKALMPGQEPFVPGRIRFGTSSICLLYRSAVKVFYATKAEADHDNYNDSSICVNKITGHINPFGGIRGDAKDLWKMIRSTREPRVRMLQVKSSLGLANNSTASSSGAAASTTSAPNTNTVNGSFGSMKQSIVDKILDEATVIVWACGYATNLFPILDAKGKEIALSTSKGQIDVDDQCRVLQADEFRFGTNIVMENLYGSGLGYGLKATLDNGEADGSSGRADGVAVYLKRGATLVLAHVIGNRVYGGSNITSWEDRNKLLRKQNLMNQSLEKEQREREASERLGVLIPESPARPGTMASPNRRVSTSHDFRSPSRKNPTPTPAPTPTTPNNNQDPTVREQAKSAPAVSQSPYLNRVSKPMTASQGRPNSASRSGRANSSTTSSTASTPSKPPATSTTSTPQTNSTPLVSKSASGVALQFKNMHQNNECVSASAPNTPNTSSKSNHNSTFSSNSQQLGKTLPARGSKVNEMNKIKNHVPIPTSNNKTPNKSQASPTVNNKPASQANAVVLKPKPFPLPEIL